MQNKKLKVAIIGGGASGTALFYTLSRYTNIEDVGLFEKYDRPGQVNSKATNNSQTLHVGDIETNYTIEKAAQVKVASMMTAHYAESLPDSEKSKILFTVPKMVLGVGKQEVAFLEERYKQLLPIFPNLKKLNREEIGILEPAIVKGRKKDEPICALYSENGYAVDFEQLSQSFVDQAKVYNPHAEVRFNSEVVSIKKRDDKGYDLHLKNGDVINTEVVIVDTDSYSLLFAKSLGYGKNYSLIPIGGTFYFSEEFIKTKVYGVQILGLPWAAIHGDPDVLIKDVNRWGATARFNPVLESRNLKTFYDYLRSSGLNHFRTWVSFVKILLNPVLLMYLLKNMLYEIPWLGKRLFVSNVKKIVPMMKARYLKKAKGYGGMRLQRVDTNTHELQLGEGKIIGDNIVFNMTPSPGASVCLYNARRDAETIAKFLGDGYVFDIEAMEADLVVDKKLESTDHVSLPSGYPA